MIFAIGDTHGDVDFKKIKNFADRARFLGLTKSDFLIILGDFGGVWNRLTLEKDLEKYKKLPVTVLFIDGNHENFEMLDAYPVSQWNGGKVHIISDNIIHLMRGQIYNIDGKSFFTFGGAESTDKQLRTEGVNWWKREIPSTEEHQEAIKNLMAHDNKVDYILTHTMDAKTLELCGLTPIVTSVNKLLDYFEENIEYSHWLIGHYHIDVKISDKKRCVFDKIIKLDTKKKNIDKENEK